MCDTAEGGTRVQRSLHEEQKAPYNPTGKTTAFRGALGGRPSCEGAADVHSVDAVLLSYKRKPLSYKQRCSFK